MSFCRHNHKRVRNNTKHMQHGGCYHVHIFCRCTRHAFKLMIEMCKLFSNLARMHVGQSAASMQAITSDDNGSSDELLMRHEVNGPAYSLDDVSLL